MRLKNIFRNSFFALLSQLLLILIGFVSQRVMNLTMGEELVGMNSVISNIIGILSVSELGISTSIVYHLYKALADKDDEKIASLMNLYRRAYYIFAVVITVSGLCVMPFVHLFLRDNSFSLSYIRLIYSLWLMRTVLSYLLSYKKSLLIADQKEYIVSIITLIINVLNYSSIVVILKLWKNYQLALFLNTIVEVILNIWISRYVDRKYVFLKRNRKKRLDTEMIKRIFGDIKNIFISRLSSKILVSTDNLIISGFISVATVGRYANYSLILQSVMNIMLTLSNALQPSVGNMFVEDKKEKNYQALRQITFAFFLLASFCAVSLMSLSTRFITDFWLSESYRLDTEVVVCCALNCYLFVIGLPITVMMAVSGMFDKERKISILYAAVNLFLSLILVRLFGISGVLLGTSVSYLVQIVFRTDCFFKDYLQRSYIGYVADMLQYGVIAFIETVGTYVVVSRVYHNNSLIRFFLAMLLCFFIPNIINLLIFMRSWRLQSVFYMVKTAIFSDKKNR